MSPFANCSPNNTSLFFEESKLPGISVFNFMRPSLGVFATVDKFSLLIASVSCPESFEFLYIFGIANPNKNSLHQSDQSYSLY